MISVSYNPSANIYMLLKAKIIPWRTLLYVYWQLAFRVSDNNSLLHEIPVMFETRDDHEISIIDNFRHEKER